jgi:hypothetical protein
MKNTYQHPNPGLKTGPEGVKKRYFRVRKPDMEPNMSNDQSSGPEIVSETTSALGLQVIREIRAATSHLPQHELSEPSGPFLFLQDEGQPSYEELERLGELSEKLRRIGQP